MTEPALGRQDGLPDGSPRGPLDGPPGESSGDSSGGPPGDLPAEHPAPDLPPPRPGRVRIQADQDPELPGGDTTGADDFYVRALMKAQLRLSLVLAVGFLAVVGVLAVGVTTWSLLEDLRFLRLPLSWWLIGFALYPLVLGAAAVHHVWARRLEDRYRRVSRP